MRWKLGASVGWLTIYALGRLLLWKDLTMNPKDEAQEHVHLIEEAQARFGLGLREEAHSSKRLVDAFSHQK